MAYAKSWRPACVAQSGRLRHARPRMRTMQALRVCRCRACDSESGAAPSLRRRSEPSTPAATAAATATTAAATAAAAAAPAAAHRRLLLPAVVHGRLLRLHLAVLGDLAQRLELRLDVGVGHGVLVPAALVPDTRPLAGAREVLVLARRLDAPLLLLLPRGVERAHLLLRLAVALLDRLGLAARLLGEQLRHAHALAHVVLLLRVPARARARVVLAHVLVVHHVHHGARDLRVALVRVHRELVRHPAGRVKLGGGHEEVAVAEALAAKRARLLFPLGRLGRAAVLALAALARATLAGARGGLGLARAPSGLRLVIAALLLALALLVVVVVLLLLVLANEHARRAPLCCLVRDRSRLARLADVVGGGGLRHGELLEAPFGRVGLRQRALGGLLDDGGVRSIGGELREEVAAHLLHPSVHKGQQHRVDGDRFGNQLFGARGGVRRGGGARLLVELVGVGAGLLRSPHVVVLLHEVLHALGRVEQRRLGEGADVRNARVERGHAGLGHRGALCGFERTVESELQVDDVGELVGLHEREGCARPARARRAAAAVDEELGLGREVVVDHDVEHWDVDTTRRNVGDDERARLTGLKFAKINFASRGVHSAVDGTDGDVDVGQE
mmetsp:Transcript_28501/g.71748  ORF Transcript_28501/g.71748 Transcript_28501/m.71748 type:complete len:617 (+) Transcript_28501:203-2053(+)